MGEEAWVRSETRLWGVKIFSCLYIGSNIYHLAIRPLVQELNGYRMLID